MRHPMHTDFDWNDAPNMRVPGAPAQARRGRSSAAGMPRIPEVDWSQAPNVRAASFDLEPAPVDPSWFESRWGTPLQTGVNQTRSFAFINAGTDERPVFEHDSDRFGPPCRSFQDLAALGASQARQLGDVDLTWSAVTLNPEGLAPIRELLDKDALAAMGIGIQVPELGAIEAGVGAAPGTGEHPVIQEDAAQRLVDLLREAHAQGVKVWLTFLHLGNGGPAAPPMAIPSVEEGTLDGSADYTPAAGLGLSPKLIADNHAALVWEDVHAGASVADDEFPERRYDFPCATYDKEADSIVHFLILDPWVPYKRMAVHRIARLFGSLLSGWVQDQLGNVQLGDVVAGVELFNEVDHGCTELKERRADTGRAWGRMCYHAARGLREFLPESVAIRLPGMSSWYPATGDAEGWGQRLAFLGGLVDGFADEFQSRAVDLFDETRLRILYPLMQGMDLHWYHFRADQVLHAAYPYFDVRDVRATLDAALADHDSPVPRLNERAPLVAMPLTFFETTSTVVVKGDAATPLPSTWPYSTLDLRLYQAWEVWRRVGAMLAAGATTAGWHCWMDASGRGDPKAMPFYGSGLCDEGYLGEGAEAAFSYRPAWFAFQRASSLLARSVGGRVLWPPARTRAELDAWLAAGDTGPAGRYLVFEFEGLALDLLGGDTLTSWAYLVCLDPTIPDTADASLTGGLRLVARDRRLSDAPVEEVVAMGISGSDESTLADERTTHRLPLEVGIPAESRRDEAVVGEAAPRLFFSSRRLAVRPWSRSVSELVPELLGEPERPMWWDVWPG